MTLSGERERLRRLDKKLWAHRDRGGNWNPPEMKYRWRLNSVDLADIDRQCVAEYWSAREAHLAS